MKKPIILTVDDDAQVLAAITRDLRQEFRADYRILSVNSGPEALTTLTELRARAEPLALVLADQRMPGVEGVGAADPRPRTVPGRQARAAHRLRRHRRRPSRPSIRRSSTTTCSSPGTRPSSCSTPPCTTCWPAGRPPTGPAFEVCG
ncbi:MAG: hypothetical protein WKG07_14605 [Hymenobacter sp.]